MGIGSSVQFTARFENVSEIDDPSRSEMRHAMVGWNHATGFEAG